VRISCNRQPADEHLHHRRPFSAPTSVCWRTVKARGHFPTEQTAIKRLYLVTRSLDPTGPAGQGGLCSGRPALNAFATTFADRFPAVLPNFGPPNYALGCTPWEVRVGPDEGPPRPSSHSSPRSGARLRRTIDDELPPPVSGPRSRLQRVLIAAGPTAGPGWTDILTAIGTVLVVAVGIALRTERRSGKRITAEHRRSDGLIREEKEHAAATRFTGALFDSSCHSSFAGAG
jgi:hypothetical protein